MSEGLGVALPPFGMWTERVKAFSACRLGGDLKVPTQTHTAAGLWFEGTLPESLPADLCLAASPP